MDQLNQKRSRLSAIGWLILGGIMAAGGSACSSSSEPAASTTTGTPSAASTAGGAPAAANSDPVEVAFITNNASDYWTIARKGTEKAQGELPNVKVDFEIPSGGTAGEQTGIVNDMVSKGVKAMAISPVDPTNQTTLIDKVVKEGVLVVTQDSDAPKSDRACYVGTDNVAAGRKLGEEIKKAIPNGGKIAFFVGKIDAQNAKERYDGLQDALKGFKYTNLGVLTDSTDRARAKANVADTLVKDPDVACLVGLWSYNGPAIINAVKDAGKAGKVKICCFDSEDETIAGLKAGTIDATIVQQPFQFGEQAIQLMTKYLRGDKSVIPASKQIIVDTQLINKDNVDQFVADQNKLLGKS